MAGYFDIFLIKLFYLILIVNNYSIPCSGIFPRSPDHPHYKIFRLVDEDICDPSLSKTKVIDLHQSGVALSVSPGSKFYTWYNRTSDWQCKFIVRAPKHERLFASIQSISFRKNGNECLDYVKFRRKDRDITPAICGDFRKRVPSFLKTEYNNNNNNYNHKTEHFMFEGVYFNFSLNLGEFDPEGEIETTIFVSQKNIDKRFELDLVIVYTPYKNCDKADPGKTISLSPYNVCINKDYICDGVENCHSICMDEKYCPSEIIHNENDTITIASVATIFISFIIFIIGLYSCKKLKILCWSPDCAGPSPTDTRHSTVSSHQIAGSPMLNIDGGGVGGGNTGGAGPTSTVDKDLPPSYESLFPD